MPGTGTIIVHAECDYRAPAFVNDALDVRVKAGEVGRSSFALHYEIVNATTGQCLANAKDRDRDVRSRGQAGDADSG